jgi:hypothetical protein
MTRVAIRALVSASGMVLALGFRPVVAQEAHGEVWPEVDAYVGLTSATRLYFSFKPVLSADDGSLSESQLGANVDVAFAPMRRIRRSDSPDRDKYHHMRARLGYWVARTPTAEGGDVTEQRILTELTPRVSLPLEMLLSLRNHVEFRWLDGDSSWRYRLRPWVERDTEVGSVTIAPYTAVEMFYDSRFDEWSRTLYQVGMSVPAADWIVPEVYYARQVDREPTEKTADILGLKVTLHF